MSNRTQTTKAYIASKSLPRQPFHSYVDNRLEHYRTQSNPSSDGGMS